MKEGGGTALGLEEGADALPYPSTALLEEVVRKEHAHVVEAEKPSVVAPVLVAQRDGMQMGEGGDLVLGASVRGMPAPQGGLSPLRGHASAKFSLRILLGVCVHGR